MHIIIIIIVAIIVYYSFIAFQKFDCFLWRVARRAEREGRRERGESVLVWARGTLVITRVNTTLSTIPSTPGHNISCLPQLYQNIFIFGQYFPNYGLHFQHLAPM